MTVPRRDSLGTSVAIPDELMLRDVRRGLLSTPKQLPPTYFYDARGSALFEAITRLPEYYLTRAERALLDAAAASIADIVPARALIELGAGSADKSRVLIREFRERGRCELYVPLDVDASTLAVTAATLSAEFPGLRVEAVEADVREQVRFPAATPRPLLCAFLGSTIGNFSGPEAQLLLSRLRAEIGADGWLLLGVDLVKDPALLERAYNDSAGVTAQFNLNVLSVLNRELGANFDLSSFEHRAFYDPGLRRIEMHLVSLADHTVTIPLVGSLEFARGESILTEISRKYDHASVEEMLIGSGYELSRWIANSDTSFALVLARPGRE